VRKWVGLGQTCDETAWIGLDLEKWTRVQLWRASSSTRTIIEIKQK